MKTQDTVFFQNIDFHSDEFRLLISDKTSSITEAAFHSAIEIKLFIQGQSAQRIGNQTILSDECDITIANPYEIHSNIMTELYDGRYYLFTVDIDFFQGTGHLDSDLKELLLINGGKFNNHIKRNERLNNILFSVIDEMNQQKPQYKAVVRNLMGQFFSLLIREEYCFNEKELPKRCEIKKAVVLIPAITKILSDYGEHLTVDMLAELCHVSKYYFCRIFKEVTGATPINYIINHRLHVARVLLSDKSQSIRQVADQCGFDDISYFYRCYKKLFNTTPRSDK